MADTFSDLLGLRLQQTGGNDNTWGDLLNTDVFEVLENAITGRNDKTSTGGTLDLSASPIVEQVLALSGVLTSDLTITMPSLKKRLLVFNATTGAFNVLMKTAAGSAVCIPRGSARAVEIWCSGPQVFRLDANEVGEIKYFGRATVPDGYLECDGSAISRTNYPDLFAAIGTTWGAGNGATTFNLPDLKTAGRFLRSRSGSVAVGMLQAADIAAHNHTASATTSVSVSVAGDGAWTPSISVSNPAHAHDVNTTTAGATIFVRQQDGGGGGINVLNLTMGNAAPFVTTSVATNISASSSSIGNHAHAGSTGSATTSVTVNNSTGTETRPINASALACIRY